MRPSSSPFNNPSGLIDKRLAPMWDKIEQVRKLLPQIAHVSYYMEELFNLQRNLDALEHASVSHHILKDVTVFQGASAYEIAVKEGFVGTEAEWLLTVKGDKGDPGVVAEDLYNALLAADSSLDTALTALTARVTQAENAIDDRVDFATYNPEIAGINAQLDGLESTITDIVNDLVPTVRTDSEIQALANAEITTALVPITGGITDVETAQATLEALHNALRAEHDSFYTNYTQFLVDNGAAITRIEVLEAASSAASASISNLETAGAGYATSITQLEAESDGFASSITSILTTQGNQATQINQLQSTNNANAAAITTLQTTEATTTDAIASLETDVTAAAAAASNAQDTADTNTGAIATNTAAISTEQTARADGDSANALAITNLTATVGSNTAAVSTQASAIADIEGQLSAYYAISVDGGGNGAFLRLDDNSSFGSAITLTADEISLNGNVIINGTVVTDTIADEAISERLVVNDGSTRSFSSSTTAESAVYNKQEASSDIQFKVHVKFWRTTGSGAFNGNVQLKRNGSIVSQGNISHYSVESFLHSVFVDITVTGVPAGNSTWSVDVVTGVANSQVTTSQMVIEEIKK